MTILNLPTMVCHDCLYIRRGCRSRYHDIESISNFICMVMRMIVCMSILLLTLQFELGSSGRNGETATRVSLSSKRSLHGKERRRRPRRSNDKLCLCFPWLSDVEPILRPQLESIVGFENAWNFVCSTSEFINYCSQNSAIMTGQMRK